MYMSYLVITCTLDPQQESQLVFEEHASTAFFLSKPPISLVTAILNNRAKRLDLFLQTVYVRCSFFHRHCRAFHY